MKKTIPIFIIILMLCSTVSVSSFSISNFLSTATNYVKVDSVNNRVEFKNLDMFISSDKKIDFDIGTPNEYLIKKLGTNLLLKTGGTFEVSSLSNTLIKTATSGNVGIGGEPDSEKKLKVSGSVLADSFYYSSDERLKTNVSVIKNPIEKIKQLEGVEFNWISNGKRSLGLIAQRVEEIFPEIVDGDEYKSVEYGNLVAPLIEAVKYQQEQIESLENRIKVLEESLK